jgi:hypothetical protein
MNRKSLVLGILALALTMLVFAGCGSLKIVDKNVPVEESAFIHIPKDCGVQKVDDTVYGFDTPVMSMGYVKGSGGEVLPYINDYVNPKDLKIANPSIQVPAGKHTVRGVINTGNFWNGRDVTHTFVAGRHYQMVWKLSYEAGVSLQDNYSKVYGELLKANLPGGSGLDWCFFDITDAVKAKNKGMPGYYDIYMKGELGKGQDIARITLGSSKDKDSAAQE